MSASTSLPALIAPEALDFAPDLLAIQERPPEKLPRVLLLCVAAVIGLMLAWAMFAKLDIIATAEGRLVPVGYTKLVQPADAGVVSEILVKDGDRVKAGQVLLRLDPRLSHADTQAMSNDVSLRRLTIARIEAELSNRAFLPGNAPAALAAKVESQFRARRLAYLDAVAQESEALNKASADLRVAQQVLAKLTQTLPSYQQTADSFRKLQKEGFVGELAAAEKNREATEKGHDLETQRASVASLQASIAQSERKIAALRSQYSSQLENERVETMTQLNRAEQELEKSQVRAGMLEIRAPNDGIVKDLAVTTQGAVVSAGALLMNVVPVDEQLQAEVVLKNEDVGFVALGQVARIKVAAYPFQKYGLLDGHVSLLNADATEQKANSPTQPSPLTYRALVRLDSRNLKAVATGETLQLSPGMLVIAEIHQGQRTVMEYLLSPVQKVAQEAARER